MRLKINATIIRDSMNENYVDIIFQNEIYQSMESDEYQYDLEMEFNGQKTTQRRSGKLKQNKAKISTVFF